MVQQMFRWITVGSKSVLAVLLCSMSQIVYGEETKEAASKIEALEQASMGNLVEVTLGLLTVLGLIFAVAWIVKRYGSFNSTAGGNLKVVGGLSLGQKERVMLVQVGEKQILLGVAPGRVETLHVLDEPIVIEENTSSTQQNSFSDKLQSALNQRLNK